MRLIEKLEIFEINLVERPDVGFWDEVTAWEDITAHARRLELHLPEDCDIVFNGPGGTYRVRFNENSEIEILLNDEVRLTMI